VIFYGSSLVGGLDFAVLAGRGKSQLFLKPSYTSLTTLAATLDLVAAIDISGKLNVWW